MSTAMNRRAILAGAAALPTATIPTLAAEPDPIFAAIEVHRAAWAALEKDCSRLSDENTPEAEAEFDRLDDAEREAAVALVDTRPTTMAGAAALLRHAAEHEGMGDEFESLEDEDDGKMKPWSYFMHRTLADALEAMRASA